MYKECEYKWRSKYQNSQTNKYDKYYLSDIFNNSMNTQLRYKETVFEKAPTSTFRKIWVMARFRLRHPIPTSCNKTIFYFLSHRSNYIPERLSKNKFNRSDNKRSVSNVFIFNVLYRPTYYFTNSIASCSVRPLKSPFI